MTRRNERNDAQAFDDALNGRTPLDADIAALVRATEVFLQAAAVEPDLAFREGLRSDLMDEASTVLVKAPTSKVVHVQPATTSTGTGTGTGQVRRRLAALTAALVASLGIVGTVNSSASALPGDVLYPVKRGMENVSLALHRGDASEGSFQLARASERLNEARALSDEGASADLVNDTLNDFTGQAGNGADALFADYTKTGSTESIDKVNDFAVASSASLAELSSRLPAGVTAFDAAATAIAQVATEASTLCTTCVPGPTQSLVDAVSKLAQGTPTDAVSSETGGGQVATESGSTPAPPKPLVVLPTPHPSPSSLGDLTDPLLGVLLGDGDQQGLVPGLLGGLGGLLGGGQQP